MTKSHWIAREKSQWKLFAVTNKTNCEFHVNIVQAKNKQHAVELVREAENSSYYDQNFEVEMLPRRTYKGQVLYSTCRVHYH